LRLTLRSIGGIGLLLANAFLAALFWLFADWGLAAHRERRRHFVDRPGECRRYPRRRDVVVSSAGRPGCSTDLRA
jgi:hypothetical protein